MIQLLLTQRGCGASRNSTGKSLATNAPASSFEKRRRTSGISRHHEKCSDYIKYYDRRGHMRSFIRDNRDHSPRTFVRYLRNISSRPWHGNELRRDVSVEEQSDCIDVLCNYVSLLHQFRKLPYIKKGSITLRYLMCSTPQILWNARYTIPLFIAILSLIVMSTAVFNGACMCFNFIISLLLHWIILIKRQEESNSEDTRYERNNINF